jgi:hypothetical protein
MGEAIFTPLRQVQVTRYITPLREGGSMPAIAEADDGFMYVLKFRGAGQGPKALIAELIGGEVALLLGLPVPELVFATVDEAFGRTEPDEEIQDLLQASTGLNLGLHYLSGAITYDAAASVPDPLLASKIVWLDSLLMNVDRTAKNTNLLLWNREMWLIDHGASLYFHHSWHQPETAARRPFPLIKDHVLLPFAHQLEEAQHLLQPMLSEALLKNITDQIPSEWLGEESAFDSQEQHRAAYLRFLCDRVAHSANFVKEAEDARKALI